MKEREKTKEEIVEEASSRLAQIFVDLIDNKKENEKLENGLNKNKKND